MFQKTHKHTSYLKLNKSYLSLYAHLLSKHRTGRYTPSNTEMLPGFRYLY